jgi:hypothetical protein
MLSREATHFCSCKLSSWNTAMNQLVIQRGIIQHTGFGSELPDPMLVTVRTISPIFFYGNRGWEGSSVRVTSSSQRSLPKNIQQTGDTDISAFSGIQTRDQSNKAAAYQHLRLKFCKKKKNVQRVLVYQIRHTNSKAVQAFLAIDLLL